MMTAVIEVAGLTKRYEVGGDALIQTAIVNHLGRLPLRMWHMGSR